MQYMLTVFDLHPECAADQFARALDEFERRMRVLDLIHSAGPLSRRCPDTLLDTDSRSHRFAFITRFRDADQSRRAIDWLSSRREVPERTHEALHALIVDPIFSFWEDLPAAAGVGARLSRA